MPPTPNISLKDWVANGYLKQAIDQLQENVRNPEAFPTTSFKAEFIKQVTLLSSRLAMLDRKANDGVIEEEHYFLEHNRIAHACLQILDDLTGVSGFTPLGGSEQLRQLAKASRLTSIRINSPTHNIKVANNNNSKININVNNDGSGSKLLKALIAIFLLIAAGISIIGTVINHDTNKEFQEVLSNGGYFEFNKFKDKLWLKTSLLEAVNDSLRNSPSVRIAGEWAPAQSQDYEQMTFYRKKCQLYLKSGSEIFPCYIKGKEPAAWRIFFRNNDRPGSGWKILFLDESSMKLNIGSEDVIFNRSI